MKEPGSTHVTNHLSDKIDPVNLQNGVDLSSVLDSFEKHYIEEALRITGANETEAAKLLQYKYSTLRYRRRKHNIP